MSHSESKRNKIASITLVNMFTVVRVASRVTTMMQIYLLAWQQWLDCPTCTIGLYIVRACHSLCCHAIRYRDNIFYLRKIEYLSNINVSYEYVYVDRLIIFLSIQLYIAFILLIWCLVEYRYRAFASCNDDIGQRDRSCLSPCSQLVIRVNNVDDFCKYSDL